MICIHSNSMFYSLYASAYIYNILKYFLKYFLKYYVFLNMSEAVGFFGSAILVIFESMGVVEAILFGDSQLISILNFVFEVKCW